MESPHVVLKTSVFENEQMNRIERDASDARQSLRIAIATAKRNQMFHMEPAQERFFAQGT